MVLKTNFDGWSQAFMKQVRNSVPTGDRRKEIERAGGETLKKHISTAAKQKHYSDNHDVDPPHMADNMVVEDNPRTEDVNVGFEDKGHIARMLNDGTKTIQGDHWYDQAFEAAKPDVFEAMKKEWENGSANSHAEK